MVEELLFRPYWLSGDFFILCNSFLQFKLKSTLFYLYLCISFKNGEKIKYSLFYNQKTINLCITWCINTKTAFRFYVPLSGRQTPPTQISHNPQVITWEVRKNCTSTHSCPTAVMMRNTPATPVNTSPIIYKHQLESTCIVDYKTKS